MTTIVLGCGFHADVRLLSSGREVEIVVRRGRERPSRIVRLPWRVDVIQAADQQVRHVVSEAIRKGLERPHRADSETAATA